LRRPPRCGGPTGEGLDIVERRRGEIAWLRTLVDALPASRSSAGLQNRTPDDLDAHSRPGVGDGHVIPVGVSTRRVEKLVAQLGVASLSKSQVSEMSAHLDVQVEAFRNRPLDAGPYTFVWVGAKGARTEIAAIRVAAPAVANAVIDRAIEVYGAAGVSDDTPLAYFYA
jgi:hypothetical protein